MAQGILVQYSLVVPPLLLPFAFNPEKISRSRSVTIKTGSSAATRGGYDFLTPAETARAAQGVEVQTEGLTLDVLFDASDQIEQEDPIAIAFGVQPQIDTLRTMMEPKLQGPGGVQTLASLGLAGTRAFEQHETASVLLFVWGLQVLPVFLTGVSQNEVQHLPNLMPFRAEVQITMQVIESRNPFYTANQVRQVATAALNTVQVVADGVESLL